MSQNPNIKVIAFDVFGTVVDWFGSVSREVEALNLGIDAAEFALAWRKGYAPAMQRTNSDPGTWVLLDELHRQILDSIIVDFGMDQLSESERSMLNEAWHRLEAWPDSVAGLTRLKRKFTICTLSNGNIGLLTNMAKRAGLPWDCILSAEVFKQYKPHQDTYLGVAKVFNLAPNEVMLVAAHQDDLAAARACGLQTAYIERPWEFSATVPKDVSPRLDNDLHASDIEHLATLLAC